MLNDNYSELYTLGGLKRLTSTTAHLDILLEDA